VLTKHEIRYISKSAHLTLADVVLSFAHTRFRLLFRHHLVGAFLPVERLIRNTESFYEYIIIPI
jgi:hypothetical protein